MCSSKIFPFAALLVLVTGLAAPLALATQDTDDWAVAGYDAQGNRIGYQSGYPSKEAAEREAVKMRRLEGTNGKIYPFVIVVPPGANAPSVLPPGDGGRTWRPVVAPTPTPRPVQPRRETLPNSTWRGGETLANYGRLTFRFGPGDTVEMIDTDGSQTGKYSRSGRSVMLRFYEGRVIYSGTLEDDIIYGSGRNGRTSWTFSVKRQ
jgi:hypothetical protein